MIQEIVFLFRWKRRSVAITSSASIRWMALPTSTVWCRSEPFSEFTRRFEIGSVDV